MYNITPSTFDPTNGEHIQYIMDNADAYSEEELTSIYNILDVDIKKRSYHHFITYNIVDVELVRELNNKLHHLDLCVQIAYGARVNFTDTFKQVRLWDAMMYYALHARQIAVPMKQSTHKGTQYAGAYVKDPLTGKHEWVVSFDVNSLYPSIMRQWNISPDRHLSLEWLKSRLEDIECLPGANSILSGVTPQPAACTPREWLADVRSADVPIVAWALRELIGYLERTDIDNTLQDLICEPDPFPWLRVLSVTLTPNKQAFRTDSTGFLPEILARLYEERKSAKAKETKAKKAAEKATNPEDRLRLLQEAVQWGLQQNTRKINLNSCYGAFGNEYFRFFDVRQAEAVTTTGQMIIRYVANQVNAYLNDEFGNGTTDYVIASDTDSIYVRLAPVVGSMSVADAVKYLNRYCETDFQAVIDSAFRAIAKTFNTQDNVLAMKREAIAEHGVWTAKKRYLLWVHDNEGVRYDPPKLKMTGIEAVRSSTPKYAREVIKKALEYFIQGHKDEFYALIDDAEAGFMSRPFEDIASPRTVNGMDTYDPGDGDFLPATPIHVKGAFTYNRYLDKKQLTHKHPKIRNGEKIRFCYLKPNNPLRTTVIAAPNTLPVEWKLDKYLDRDLQFEKSVLAPLEHIIKTVGWEIRPVVSLF